MQCIQYNDFIKNQLLTGLSGKLDLSDTAAIELSAPPRECPAVLREYPAAGPAS